MLEWMSFGKRKVVELTQYHAILILMLTMLTLLLLLLLIIIITSSSSTTTTTTTITFIVILSLFSCSSSSIGASWKRLSCCLANSFPETARTSLYPALLVMKFDQTVSHTARRGLN